MSSLASTDSTTWQLQQPLLSEKMDKMYMSTDGSVSIQNASRKSDTAGTHQLEDAVVPSSGDAGGNHSGNHADGNWETLQHRYHENSSSRRKHSSNSGSILDYTDIVPVQKHSDEDLAADEHRIGEAPATAICSNVITSGVFFTVGLAAGSAGVWSPLCFLLVSLTLYLFRDIYGEAVTALPLNGGAYNLLLLTTSKGLASVGALLTMMAYACSGVISSASGVDYLASVFPEIPKELCTLGVLLVFALLTFWGFKESAMTSLVIFAIHITILSILFVTSIIFISKNGIQPVKDLYASAEQPNFLHSIFYGFSIASLAVTGFETSANFVEELKPGVFEKTLRNMWWFCLWINPGFSLLGILAVDADVMRKEPNATLAVLGRVTGGTWLQALVSVDAFVVLAGAVLTDYLGFIGVAERMAMDQCLPRFFLAKNNWRNTKHWLILGFLLLCTSMYLLLEGKIAVLANVYAVSFFGVMGLYAVGDMLLKTRCSELPRNVRASWLTLIGAFILVAIAFSGVVFSNTDALVAFSYYFVGAGSLVALMFWRVQILTVLFHSVKLIYREIGWIPVNSADNSDASTASDIEHDHDSDGEVEHQVDFVIQTSGSETDSSNLKSNNQSNDEFVIHQRRHSIEHRKLNLTHRIKGSIREIQDQPIVFFAKRPIASNLNRVISYVLQNENSSHIRFVHCYDSSLAGASSMSDIQAQFNHHLEYLQTMYPKMKFDLVVVQGHFCPEAVLRLSNELGIARYMMCINCPKQGFQYDIEKLGGVRVIVM